MFAAMMPVEEQRSLIIAVVCLALLLLCTIPAFTWVVDRVRGRKEDGRQADVVYEDADGVASAESQKKYWATKLHLYAAGVVALATAFAITMAVWAAVLGAPRYKGVMLWEPWGVLVGWLFLDLQSAITMFQKTPQSRYKFTKNCGASAILLCAATTATLLGPVSVLFDGTHTGANTIIPKIFASTIPLALLASFLYLSFPERPDVYTPDGRVVERQNTVSFLNQFAYMWATPLLRYCASKSTVEIDELPALHHQIRSKYAAADFTSIALKDDIHLAVRIFWFHMPDFALQWTLAICVSFLNFAPQYSVLQLLRTLERRGSEGDAIGNEAWVWVAALGVSTVVNVFTESRLNWVNWARVSIPIRAKLAAQIFLKAMKRKDCKEPPQKDEKTDSLDDPSQKGIKPAEDKKDEDGKPKDKEQKSDQDTINLIAIDTSEVAQFGAMTNFYILFVFKIVIATLFLLNILGWQALLAGLATNIVVLPINTWLSKRYGNWQKSLKQARDDRTKVLREALSGIRQIKFSALEVQWEARINEVRDKELKNLWGLFLTDLMMRTSWNAGPVVLAAATLFTYTVIHGTLTPSVAFTSIGVFMNLESIIGMIPELIATALDAKIAVDRIDSFLRAPEKIVNTSPSDSVSFHNVDVAFPSDNMTPSVERFTLKNINLQFPNKELSVISGKTGSGKSLLLAAILGEVDVLKGEIYVPRCPPLADRYDAKANAANWIIESQISYVSQTPWIQNTSIKNNILFGLPLDESRYAKVIKACALTKDLEMFPDGDQTEVGAQGISLSGGQRWRLTLARAIYSRAGILIMDDLFSALDAHVGREIYENALTGELSEGRTRILVTHHVSLCLSKTKYTVRLQNGTIEYAGMTDQLAERIGLDEMVKEAEADLETSDDTDSSKTPVDAEETANGTAQSDNAAKKAAAETRKPKKLVEDETRETGSVKRKYYARYLKASGGYSMWVGILLVYVIAQLLYMGRSWWVKIWTQSYAQDEQANYHVLHSYTYQAQMMHSNFENSSKSSKILNGVTTTTTEHETLGYYLGIYVLVSVGYVLIGTCRYLWIYLAAITAAKKTFRNLTHTVMRMPLRWIDTVPLGRILNRFTADVTVMDWALARQLAQFSAIILELLGVLVSGTVVSPWIIVLAAILLGICLKIGQSYLDGARQVKRLESVCKSPIFEHFGSSLKGLSTIRASDQTSIFLDSMFALIDKHTVAWWHNWLFNRWLGFRLAFFGSLFSTAVAAMVVTIKGVDASLAGFALAFSLDYGVACVVSIRLYAQTQLSMNATERVVEYTDLETERQDGKEVRASWPEEGRIEVKDLVAGYADDLPAILKGLTFSVEKCQRVGVVGRTGAGKSTLSLTLFRFLEARSGSIVIDGVDISTIKLSDLRTRLAIIPQDPVLFSGTIRSNLDPFSRFDDAMLLKALKSVHLIPSHCSTDTPSEPLSSAATIAEPASSPDVVEPAAQAAIENNQALQVPAASTPESANENANTNIFLSLDSPISDGGSNLSQGQRQLLCLARSIILRPKIMILDEATSAVDMATDRLIQQTIREEFRDTTLLVVAHRLSTVADFDRILVMSDGRAVEFGTPRELYFGENGQEGGLFRGMVESSGEREAVVGLMGGEQGE